MKVTHILLAGVLAGPLGYTQTAAGALSPSVGVASTAPRAGFEEGGGH